MVSAIQIGNIDFLLMNVKPADGTIVEHEPGSHSKGSLSPRKFEDGAHQAHEKTSVTDKRDAVFRLSLLIFVTSQQVSQNLIGAWLALFFRFEWTIPPTCFIQFLWKDKGRKVLQKKRAGSTGQTSDVGFVAAAENAALFMDFLPCQQRNFQCLCNGRGGIHRPLHHAGIDVCKSKTITVLNIPDSVVRDGLIFL